VTTAPPLLLTKARFSLEARFLSEYGECYGRLFDPIQLENTFSRRLMIKVSTKMLRPSQNVKFVWATGGDSVAAGHGNMFNQSYTAMMDGTVSDAFAALGLEFVARNFGMSMHTSAPELVCAWKRCMEMMWICWYGILVLQTFRARPPSIVVGTASHGSSQQTYPCTRQVARIGTI
jgi:hypothetical protein